MNVAILRPLILSAALTLRQREALSDLISDYDRRMERERSHRSEDDTARLSVPVGHAVDR